MEQGTSPDNVHEYCPYGELTRAITKRLGGSFQYAKSITLGVVFRRKANDTFQATKRKDAVQTRRKAGMYATTDPTHA